MRQLNEILFMHDLIPTDPHVIDLALSNMACRSDLYDYYLMNGRMPYGVAKCRTGDPEDWMASEMDKELFGKVGL